MNDKREGRGYYRWSDGSSYKGEWSRDRMNGVGKLDKPDLKVVGLFINDQFARLVDEV